MQYVLFTEVKVSNFTTVETKKIVSSVRTRPPKTRLFHFSQL